jgi:hypothetical protein
MSRGSSNRKAGFDLALGNAPEKQSEGMASVASVASRLGAKASGLPLMSFVLNMVQSKSLDKSGWENILNA